DRWVLHRSQSRSSAYVQACALVARARAEAVAEAIAAAWYAGEQHEDRGDDRDDRWQPECKAHDVDQRCKQNSDQNSDHAYSSFTHVSLSDSFIRVGGKYPHRTEFMLQTFGRPAFRLPLHSAPCPRAM